MPVNGLSADLATAGLAEGGYDLCRGYFVTSKPEKMNASNRSLADLRRGYYGR
jgi:hypothetical protein